MCSIMEKKLTLFSVALLPLFFCLSSCAMSGLTDGFSRLSVADRASVSYLSRDSIRSTTSIVMLNAKELISRMDSTELNAVYYYIPNCIGDRCIPLSSIRNRLKDKAKLYVVTRSLDSQVLSEAKKQPIFGIDKYHYKKKYLFKYEKLFFDELTSRSNSEEDSLNLYLFKGHKFLKMIDLSKDIEL